VGCRAGESGIGGTTPSFRSPSLSLVPTRFSRGRRFSVAAGHRPPPWRVLSRASIARARVTISVNLAVQGDRPPWVSTLGLATEVYICPRGLGPMLGTRMKWPRWTVLAERGSGEASVHAATPPTLWPSNRIFRVHAGSGCFNRWYYDAHGVPRRTRSRFSAGECWPLQMHQILAGRARVGPTV
jgi:hypothetical protein